MLNHTCNLPASFACHSRYSLSMMSGGGDLSEEIITVKHGGHAYRQVAARVLGAAALILLSLAAYYLRPSPSVNLLDEAFWFAVGGALTLWLALFLHQSVKAPEHPTPNNRIAGIIMSIWRRVVALLKPRSPTPPDIPLTPARLRLLPLLLGGVALAVLAEINGHILGD